MAFRNQAPPVAAVVGLVRANALGGQVTFGPVLSDSGGLVDLANDAIVIPTRGLYAFNVSLTFQPAALWASMTLLLGGVTVVWEQSAVTNGAPPAGISAGLAAMLLLDPADTVELHNLCLAAPGGGGLGFLAVNLVERL